MGRASNRVSFAADTYPLPPRGSGSGSGGSGGGSYNVPIGELPFNGGAGLYAIPSDYDLFPASGPPWGNSHSFVLPWAATLTAIRLRGDPSIGTTNTLLGAPVAPPTVRSHNVASSGTASVSSQAVVLASVLAASSVYVAVQKNSTGPLASVTDSAGNTYNRRARSTRTALAHSTRTPIPSRRRRPTSFAC